MKYVSLVFVFGLMWWTWCAAHSPSDLSEATHVGIQNDLRRVITEYLEQNIPQVGSIKFEKFWTETLKKGQVKATFSYSFEEGNPDGNETARIGIDGHAILNQSKDENSEFDIWTLDELYVLNNRVDFKEGIQISPETNNSSPEHE